MHDLWPETKFVHLIRDGRDVCLSMMNWKKADSSAGQFSAWKEDRVSTGALWWELNVRLGRQDGGSLAPELYHEVRYEALISEPEETCANLCDFLGLSYDDAMLKFHEGPGEADPDLDAKKGWRPLTPGLRKWSEQMSTEDLRRFEAAAGDLLELGYPRAVPDPPEEALAWTARIREILHLGRPLLGGPATSGLDDVNPYVFIVGCPRSGTTLLQRMVTPIPELLSSSRRTGSRAGSRSAGADIRRLRDPEAR